MEQRANELAQQYTNHTTEFFARLLSEGKIK